MGHHQQEVHRADNHQAHDRAPAHPGLFQQAQHEATQALQTCANEFRVMGGVVSGAGKATQKELKENPGGLAIEAGVSGAIGVTTAFAPEILAAGSAMGGAVGCAATAAAAVAAAPEVVGGVLIVGGGLLAWDQLVNKAERNQKVMHALIDAAKPGQSEAHILHDMHIVEDQLGGDALHGLIALAGGAAHLGTLALKEAESVAAKEAMNAALRAGSRNNHVTSEMMQNYQKGNLHALERGGLTSSLKPQTPLKFESNSRPPETPQGLHHIVIEGQGH